MAAHVSVLHFNAVKKLILGNLNIHQSYGENKHIFDILIFVYLSGTIFKDEEQTFKFN
jgi:hypothetical protein